MGVDKEAGRTLTDGDIEAVVLALESRLSDRFFHHLGKGIWATVWRALVVLALLLAAYGSLKGISR